MTQMTGATSSEAVAADVASAPSRKPRFRVFQLRTASVFSFPSLIFGTGICAPLSIGDDC